METAVISQGLQGDKLYQARARKTLPILVRQAKAAQTIYYSDLADELGMPNPRNLNFPLGSIGTSLNELREDWEEDIPQIQCLVVNKMYDLPGDGISPFLGDGGQFAKLTSRQKKALVDHVLALVYGYSRWDDVLSALDLEPAPISAAIGRKVIKAASRAGGGEGPGHRKLKLFVQANPERIGIKLNGLKSATEKLLPSGDSVDVFFENDKSWIGVEVKSKTSDDFDILRGLYQCVKYHAIMDSYLSVLDSQRNTRVLLALSGEFPESLIPVKNTLGIEVVDNINE